MEADKDDGDYFLVLLQRWCDLTLQWDERSNSCRRLADLVDQRSVRDHTEDKLDEETYRLLITSVLLGWQQQKQEEMKAVQTFFVEMMSIPEFENAAVEKFVDDGFLIQLCGRFQAGDPEERLFLRNTLHWAYNSFPRSRPLLRRQIGTVLGHFARAPSRNTHVAQMLEVLCQIIKGFPESLTDVCYVNASAVLLNCRKQREEILDMDETTNDEVAAATRNAESYPL